MKIEKLLKQTAFIFCAETISEQSKKELLSVYELCKEKKWNFHNLKPLLIKMIEHDVPPNWSERIQRSKMEFGRDSSSLESFECRYGKIIGKNFWKEKTEKCTTTKDKYIQKYGIKSWENLCISKISNNMEILIKRYGEEGGKRKKEEYLKKWRKSIKDKVESGWDNGLSLRSFVEKHGEEIGFEKWNARRENQRNRFSKKWYYRNYGSNLGEIKWNEYCSHMADLSYKANRKNSSTYSKKSQKLFWKIVEKLNLQKDLVMFAENFGEKQFKFDDYRRLCGGYWFAVDFFYENKIVEFDGHYWHRLEKTRKRDMIKTQILEQNGYEVFRIPEKEYDKNPLQIEKKCIEFILRNK